MTEIKVTFSTIGSFLASLVLALLNSILADSSVLGSWPAWLQFTFIALAPTVVTFLGGYLMPSPTSRVSDGFTKVPFVGETHDPLGDPNFNRDA